MEMQEMIGKRFGSLVVVQKTDRPQYYKTQGRFWLCACDCGGSAIHPTGHLNAGRATRCRECTSTGHIIEGNQSPTYRSWRGMKERCLSPSHASYQRYGGRGIKFCARWRNFRNFLADMGERPEGLTLDRIDNDGDYEPGNCRWATQKQQVHNSSITQITDDDVFVIRALAQIGAPQKHIGHFFGITPKYVSCIVTGASRSDAVPSMIINDEERLAGVLETLLRERHKVWQETGR